MFICYPVSVNKVLCIAAERKSIQVDFWINTYTFIAQKVAISQEKNSKIAIIHVLSKVRFTENIGTELYRVEIYRVFNEY